MDQAAFILNADVALANFISHGIEKEFAGKNIVTSMQQISFSSPKTIDTIGTRKLSIFLYDVTEETTARTISAPEDGPKIRATQRPLVLRYLVTPSTGNDKDDHALIEKIIRVLEASPFIVSSNDENNVRLSVKIDSLSLDELSKLWIALGTPLRLSLSLTVSSVDPWHDPQTLATDTTVTPPTQGLDTKHVSQLYQAVLKTFTEQSTGWRDRNILFKQFVLRDFKKNTTMTAEEMLISLNNLGDKLEQQGPTAQFVTSLNLLAGYYEHQFDQLKGLRRVSRKQRENLETINTWIKDIKTLVEALDGKNLSPQ